MAYQFAVFPAEACLPGVFLLWNQVISRFHRALICLRRIPDLPRSYCPCPLPTSIPYRHQMAFWNRNDHPLFCLQFSADRSYPLTESLLRLPFYPCSQSPSRQRLCRRHPFCQSLYPRAETLYRRTFQDFCQNRLPVRSCLPFSRRLVTRFFRQAFWQNRRPASAGSEDRCCWHHVLCLHGRRFLYRSVC